MPTVIGHHDIYEGEGSLARVHRNVRRSLVPSVSRTSERLSIRRTQPKIRYLMDVADLDALMAAMQSEAAAEAMAHDGVVPESLVILIEE